METQDRPNLFTYATSELSQDAFICWLAQWADPKYRDADPALHQTGQEFVVSMIQKVKTGFESTEIESVNVVPQFQKLDILIKINGDTPTKLAILVEDKTHTSNHSDQLNRYLKSVQEAGYLPDQMVPLYFKTGYQSRFDTLGEFRTYLRNDLLTVLEKGVINGVANAIYADFLAHLQEIDALIRRFSTKPADKWGYHDWVGFFTVLYDQRAVLGNSPEDDGADWGYVPNQSGGFVGYWWYFKKSDRLPNVDHIYLQMEQDCLCFKIEISNEDKHVRATARDTVYATLKDHGGSIVQRPSRMGNGKCMTVAQWNADYRVFSGQQLDIDATLANIKKAQEVIDAAFPSA